MPPEGATVSTVASWLLLVSNNKKTVRDIPTVFFYKKTVDRPEGQSTVKFHITGGLPPGEVGPPPPVCIQIKV